MAGPAGYGQYVNKPYFGAAGALKYVAWAMAASQSFRYLVLSALLWICFYQWFEAAVGRYYRVYVVLQ